MNSLVVRSLRGLASPTTARAAAAAALQPRASGRVLALRSYTTSNGEQQQQQQAEEPLPEDPAQLKELAKKLRTDLAEKDGQLKETHEKYLRALAEMENVRVRGRRDVDSAKQFGIHKFSKELLDVVDVLDMAIKSVPAGETGKEGNEHLKNLYEGIVMTEKEIMKVFEKNGVARFDPAGEKFDPNLHEALFEIPDPSKPHGTVAMVQKLGYTLHGRTLRPAQVGVIKAK